VVERSSRVVDEKCSVLVVEDEDANVDLLVRTLRDVAQLHVARGLDEARAILAKTAINIVISDHRLPDGKGTELLEEIAKKHPAIGRILVTGYGDSQEVVAAATAGTVERFFLKPFSPARMKSTVLEFSRRQGSSQQATVLVADDDVSIRAIVRQFLSTRRINVVEASNGVEALERISEHAVDAAVIDIDMPKLDGIGLLKQLLAKDPELPVILMTSAEGAFGYAALEAGAHDLVGKPLRSAELLLRVERAFASRQQAAENRRLQREVESHRKREALVAESDSMKALLEQVRLLAQHDVNVLVTGETGTGKEVLARLIHKSSRRTAGPFIPVNCGAIPDSLIESQLFGHEKGAFTDAKTAKPGFFVSADGGTLFLDEVGELSPGAQVRLLRALEMKEITPVGSSKPVKVDVRVVAATHRDLEAMKKEGSFREDLMYRLNGFMVRLPPLRERLQDLAPLIEMAAADFCSRNGLPTPPIGPTALKQARSYAWPGNIRQLLHVVERTLITRGPARIDELDLPTDSHAELITQPQADDSLPLEQALTPLIEALERDYLLRVLKRSGWRLGPAAQHPGNQSKSLYKKQKR
jgi:two-component system, NtrC family, response regulator AtoC